MSSLKVWKDTGVLLFDTDKITYGLVKSGYMTYLQSWTRKALISSTLDPNNGSSWTQTTATAGTAQADSMYGFTVYNALSPIVFIVGTGCLNGTSVSGNAMTFYYANADANTKFYCFDLMSDNIAGSPYLKTFDTTGRITFNSLQPPLNVATAVQAPGPGATDMYGRYVTTYAGGYNVRRQVSSGQEVAKIDSRVDIALVAGVEFAAFLPWSRTCTINDIAVGTNVFPFTQYGGSEGAYGRVGGMSFLFGAAGGTTQAYPNSSGYTATTSYVNIPTDRYPIALLIATTNYPFPFN